jgi:hypothetical protein
MRELSSGRGHHLKGVLGSIYIWRDIRKIPSRSILWNWHYWQVETGDFTCLQGRLIVRGGLALAERTRGRAPRLGHRPFKELYHKLKFPENWGTVEWGASRGSNMTYPRIPHPRRGATD